jgi:hypothetical protein
MNDAHRDDSVTEPTSEGASAVLGELANSVEAALNLVYLIEHERHDPDAVLKYVRTLDGALKRMTSLIIQTQKLNMLNISTQ